MERLRTDRPDKRSAGMNVICENARRWIAIYRCEAGGIHLVYQNVNIGMTRPEFLALNRSLQEVAARSDGGEQFPACVSLHYRSTTVAIRADHLREIALTLSDAAARIECLVEVEEESDQDEDRHVHHPIPHVRLN